MTCHLLTLNKGVSLFYLPGVVLHVVSNNSLGVMYKSTCWTLRMHAQPHMDVVVQSVSSCHLALTLITPIKSKHESLLQAVIDSLL